MIGRPIGGYSVGSLESFRQECRKYQHDLIFSVIPAQAGIHLPTGTVVEVWIPACAGMTV